MRTGRCLSSGLFVLAVSLLGCGIAFAATRYSDPAGDVTGGPGPDIVAVGLSNTRASITFRVRFAGKPPLRVSTPQQWVDMLLIAVDVPPLGPRPVTPGGEWPGADFAFGTHGPSKTGQLVRLGSNVDARPRRVGTFRITTEGATVTFSIPRRSLGNPSWFAFSVAAARETARTDNGGVDLAPARGAFRYTLTRGA